MSDDNQKPAKPAKSPKLRPEDPEIDLKVKSPVPWMILSMIPLVMLLLMALNSYKEPSPVELALTTPSPKKYWAEELKKSGDIHRDYASLSQVDQAKQDNRNMTSPGHEPANPGASQTHTPPCDFAPWVGSEVTTDILHSVEASKRPYRILPPGSMMTMDHSPARINFDVDDHKKITRVWCG